MRAVELPPLILCKKYTPHYRRMTNEVGGPSFHVHI